MHIEKRIPKIRVVNRNNSDDPTCLYVSLKTVALLSASFYILVALTQLVIQWIRFFNVTCECFPTLAVRILVLMGDFNVSYLVAMILVSVFLLSFAGWAGFGIYTLAKQNLFLINRYCMGHIVYLTVEGFGQVIVMLDFFMAYGIGSTDDTATEPTSYTASQIIYHAFIIIYIGLSFVFTISLWRYNKHLQKQEYLKQKESSQKEYVHHVETAISKFDEEKASPETKESDVKKPELAKEKLTA
ncbi:hypothetical protein HK096_002212 [Nowakowskiella sp. JEL0078]|nr:hypothetical protein HK096_002212 [Nowakowskiella sp. JEL0078]